VSRESEKDKQHGRHTGRWKVNKKKYIVIKYGGSV